MYHYSGSLQNAEGFLLLNFSLELLKYILVRILIVNEWKFVYNDAINILELR